MLSENRSRFNPYLANVENMVSS